MLLIIIQEFYLRQREANEISDVFLNSEVLTSVSKFFANYVVAASTYRRRSNFSTVKLGEFTTHVKIDGRMSKA